MVLLVVAALTIKIVMSCNEVFIGFIKAFFSLTLKDCVILLLLICCFSGGFKGQVT